MINIYGIFFYGGDIYIYMGISDLGCYEMKYLDERVVF